MYLDVLELGVAIPDLRREVVLVDVLEGGSIRVPVPVPIRARVQRVALPLRGRVVLLPLRH